MDQTRDLGGEGGERVEGAVSNGKPEPAVS